MSWTHNPVGWFEIPVTDMDRAQKFYEAVFHIEIQRHEMQGMQMGWFPMIPDTMGATGTLMLAESYVPSHDGTMVYFTAPNGDIDTTLKSVEEQGGKVMNPKMSIGEHGFVAHFEDSEGNRIALHSRE